MDAWQIEVRDADQNVCRTLSVEAANIDGAHRAAADLAETQGWGTEFRGADFLWRVTANKVCTYKATRPLLYPKPGQAPSIAGGLMASVSAASV